MNLQMADAYVWAGGYYDRDQPNPVNLDLYLIPNAPPLGLHQCRDIFRADFISMGLLFKGEDARFHPQIDISGELKSTDLVVANRPVGDVDVKLKGAIDNYQTRMETSELELFQGKWQFVSAVSEQQSRSSIESEREGFAFG